MDEVASKEVLDLNMRLAQAKKTLRKRLIDN